MPATKAPKERVETPRSKLRAFVESRMAEQEATDLPSLVDDALDHFWEDQEFVEGILRDRLRTDVYDIAQRIIASTRGLMLMGDSVVSQEEFRRRVAVNATKFSTWVEHTGTSYVALMDMTKGDLLASADERERRGMVELRIATLWRSIANQLRANERVRDRFTAEELVDLDRSVVVKQPQWAADLIRSGR